VNDLGNTIVKTIESTEESFVNVGMKRGQILKPQQPEETAEKKKTENPKQTK